VRGHRSGRCQRHRQDGVRTESRFVGRPVELEHRQVERSLVFGIHSQDCRLDDVNDVLDCAQDALAQVTASVTVA